MVDLVLGLAVAASLFAYLVVALMRPDRAGRVVVEQLVAEAAPFGGG